ncbi:MAG TPA: hypothetical protein VM658_13470 [bacterium]|nr:hypothetical protein [bacterium]
MTYKVKNVRPGILVVPDAGLRLAPGAVVEVKALTPQLDKALKKGWLVNTEAGTNMPLFDEPEPRETVGEDTGQEEVDITKLSATEAITKVSEEDNADKLKALMSTEKRRTVLDALKKRLTEVEGGSG